MRIELRYVDKTYGYEYDTTQRGIKVAKVRACVPGRVMPL